MFFENLTIGRIIIHEIFVRGEDKELVQPIYGEQLLTLHQYARDALQLRITNALGKSSHGVEMSIGENGNESAWHKAKGMIESQGSDQEFVNLSQSFAGKLAASQTNRNVPGGIVVVVDGTCGNPVRSFMCLIKAEPHGGFTKRQTGDQLTLEYIKKLILTPQAKLYKIGAFLRNDPGAATAQEVTAGWRAFLFDDLIAQGNNLWGSLALDKFSARFEATPVAGVTTATLAAAAASVASLASVDWAKVERVKMTDAATDADGIPNQTPFFGAPASSGKLRNNSMFLPWGSVAKDTLTVTHQGPGKPWLTLQSIAAIQLKAPFNAGYQIKKTILPVEQAVEGIYTRGDVLRIVLEVNASADMTWVVISDPVPGGATILGGGLGRDSEIATSDEGKTGTGWPAFEERSFEAFRSYYAYLPKGVVKMEYTVRLNNVGDFALPPSRVEAMYAPEMFGASPNARVKVEAAK